MSKGALVSAFRESIEGTGTPIYPPTDKKEVSKSIKENVTPITSTSTQRSLYTTPFHNHKNNEDVNYPVAVKKTSDDAPKDIKFRVDNVIPGLTNEKYDIPKFLKSDEKSQKNKKKLADIYQKPKQNFYVQLFWSLILWILSFFMNIQKPEVDKSQIELSKLRKDFDSAVQKGDVKKSQELADQLANFYKKKN